MAAVWVGAYLTWLDPVYYGPLVAGLAAFLVCAAGNVINDIVDIDIDRINRPERVLVRGDLSISYARNLAIVLALLALISGVAVNIEVTVAVAAALVLLLLYNLWLKRVRLVGNVVIALLSGLTFMTGGWAVNPQLAMILPGPLIPAVFAVFFHMVREILKDAQDVEGDRRAGVTTLPQKIGVPASVMAGLILFFVLVILTYIPILTGWFGGAYEIITVYVVDLPILGLLIFVWGSPTRRMLRIGSAALKLGMLLGLVALLTT